MTAKEFESYYEMVKGCTERFEDKNNKILAVIAAVTPYKEGSVRRSFTDVQLKELFKLAGVEV